MRFNRFAALLAAATLALSGQSALAGDSPEDFNLLRRLFSSGPFLPEFPFGYLESGKADFDPEAIPAAGVGATFALSNYGADTEPGEPKRATMKRSVWGGLRFGQDVRVVIHTYGTAFNTLLAAYRGSSFSTFAPNPVAFNDDKPLTGIGATQSLIQFKALANTDYRVQIGSKANAEGNVFASISVFPPTGGLTAWLASYFGHSFEGRDYICELGYTGGSTCPAAQFMLHNSTAGPLTVSMSSSVGGALTAPGAIIMQAGTGRKVQFTYNMAFNKSQPRTLAGHFTFVGKSGATTVSTVKVRSLVVVSPPSQATPDVLKGLVKYPVRTGHMNESIPFDVRLINTGSQAAVGCHARSDFYSRLKTTWRRLNPTNGAVSAPNLPTNIPAGGTQWFRVNIASQESRLADAVSLGEVILDCANTAEWDSSDIRHRIDVTALGHSEPADVLVTCKAPTVDRLDVPAGVERVFRVAARNVGPTATLTVFPAYAGWYTDAANTRFGTRVCRTATDNGPCLAGGPTASVDYTATRNKTFFFKIFVRGPNANPGFDAGKRRVFARFEQRIPLGSGTSDVLVGVQSVAPRRT